MLDEPSLEIRTKTALKYLNNELKMLEMKNEIQSKVKSELDEQQREYLLNQQLKAIQDDMLPFGIINDGQEKKEGVGDGEGNVWFEAETRKSIF